ncbi:MULTISPECIES: SGNH/GDSL hydrolase family protein [unclassified Bradyrhizobium]|uniref:SGNH/GDSL hydrolase family protein n=1 Tax=unclassified Bradyrhizobium TaxID=2631580 RepID=UPI0024794C41|nr:MULTISPECIES: SGNH/GDSL hydrolase family protein [unclassified Bradyrhizobium]WGR71124.1 SGNH/GDSL hydrolase family protein [Bradyrhizobium sp. ISRA426]WGR75960.1 SGNH/GDSL hydrolase family protein [Bradyrhizobium sp. ISRA430]WGR86364.1 SGNH/GDSL hydrolase family protein [Bradyrhizobium sp. ISRA432]
MSSLRPFCLSAWLAASTAALLLTSASLSPAQAQAAQATPAPQQTANNPAPASQSQTTAAATTQPPAEQRGITARAIDKVKQAAKSAGDIFNRVPCLPPKGGAKTMGSLPHVANKLVEGKPVVIVAFGSSSTAGFGASSPEFNYPNRLAAQLRRHYPTADISVINAGVGGEDAPEMMKRLQTEVIDRHPDLVIWQVGTNAVLRNLDPGETAKLVEDGIGRIQAAGGADIVLVDPQYSPQVNRRAESAGKMVKLLGKVAELRHVGIFPRFEVMREWHEKQAIPVESFVIADGLHMNDWGYACFAQLLGDDIIQSVGQIKLGVNVPADVRTYRPM